MITTVQDKKTFYIEIEGVYYRCKIENSQGFQNLYMEKVWFMFRILGKTLSITTNQIKNAKYTKFLTRTFVDGYLFFDTDEVKSWCLEALFESQKPKLTLKDHLRNAGIVVVNKIN